MDHEFLVVHTQRLVAIRHRLLNVYGQPEWRNPLPLVDEMVSTFLSQNTNDTNRDKAFFALKDHFLNWEAVRDADLTELMDVIRIAGLANQKGPNIQNALRIITEQEGRIALEFLQEMSIDQAKNWLTNLKGVGPKTAAIVLLFSLGMPAFPVDTHIYRVTGRIGLRPMSMNVEKVHIYLETISPPESYYDLHLNLIRLGRETCQARKPMCWQCPVVDLCCFESKTDKSD